MAVGGDNRGTCACPVEYRTKPEPRRAPAAGADGLATVLLIALLAAMVLAGRAPYSREDWLLENALIPPVLAVLAALRFGRARVRLSTTAWLALFLFLLLHEVGSHYTYSFVPYRQWLQSLGLPLALVGRNYYDRMVHFAYGLLVAQPVAEVIAARTGMAGRSLLATTVAWMACGSMLYELIEWGAAMAFGGDLGVAYLGTQGDPWDAQRDMALALSGSLLWACIPGSGKPPLAQVRATVRASNEVGYPPNIGRATNERGDHHEQLQNPIH